MAATILNAIGYGELCHSAVSSPLDNYDKDMRSVKRLATFLAAGLVAAPAFAATPEPGGLGLQEPATPLADEAYWFHDVILMPIITIITIFVFALLIYVMFRYNRKANPVPSKFTHNFTIEVLWTGIPILILIFIAFFSFRLLYMFDSEPNLEQVASGEADPWYEVDAEAAAEGWINVKVQGHQWYWTYSYPDLTDADGYAIEFISNGIHKGLSTDRAKYEELGRADFDTQPKNLAVDYPLVVPANRYVRYYTAAADVIHSFAVPAFAIKTDAVPGRLNQGWFYIEEPGVYYGQCSELCGKNHAFMPIEVRVVPQEQYDRWLEVMKTGDVDAATELVQVIDPMGEATRLASVE